MNLPKFVTREKTDYHVIDPCVSKVLFTKDECKGILDFTKSNSEKLREHIGGEGGKDSSRYFVDMNALPWVYERMYNFMLEANEENYRLDPDFCLTQQVAINEYTGKDYCGWHTDGYLSDGSDYLYRKLTCVVQMSEPTDYTGGDFELFAYHAIKEDIKPMGTAFIIPSFEWHRVTPIESGVRRSMIMFLEGTKTFK